MKLLRSILLPGWIRRRDTEETEIIEDMYATKRDDAISLDIFHAKLDIIVERYNISYFDAFVVSIDHTSISGRTELETYLFKIGFMAEDVRNLSDAYYAEMQKRGE